MTTIHNFTEAYQYLSQFYDNARTKYDLDNMRRLMAYLHNPQDAYKVIHVAGTSGKTSTAYYAAALLTAAGHTTGLTVSPHVDALNERTQVNMRLLPEAEFCQKLAEFLDLLEGSGVPASWFEVVVAFAYWYFREAGVEYAVIEVGLGGLMDGTNVISRADKVCVITDIGYDHVHILGNSLEQIAAQKAGIILPHNQVFMHRQGPAVMTTVQAAAEKQQAGLHIIDDNPADAPRELPGFQQRNFELARAAVDYTLTRDGYPELTARQLQAGQTVYIPGRMEVMERNGKQLVLDGAHNEQKMSALLASFRERYPGVKPAILLALKEGKDYEPVVPLLAPFAARIFVTAFSGMQDLPFTAMEPEQLAAALRQAGLPDVAAIPDLHKAYQALLASPEEMLLVTGSFYLLQQLRDIEKLV